MNRKEALAELIAKVEAGEPNRNNGTLYALFGDNWVNAWDVIDRGSLDAAKALHDAVLPGWWWLASRDETGAMVQIRHPVRHAAWINGFDDDPARAWLLAILRALHAQEAAE